MKYKGQYLDAYLFGKKEGYHEGRIDGINSANKVKYDILKKKYDEGYEEGKKDGIIKERKNAEQRGWERGYEEGHREGFEGGKKQGYQKCLDDIERKNEAPRPSHKLIIKLIGNDGKIKTDVIESRNVIEPEFYDDFVRIQDYGVDYWYNIRYIHSIETLDK